jgi:hypothetical protein
LPDSYLFLILLITGVLYNDDENGFVCFRSAFEAIVLFNSVADPDNFDTDPDLTFGKKADPDQTPEKKCGSGSCTLYTCNFVQTFLTLNFCLNMAYKAIFRN